MCTHTLTPLVRRFPSTSLIIRPSGTPAFCQKLPGGGTELSCSASSLLSPLLHPKAGEKARGLAAVSLITGASGAFTACHVRLRAAAHHPVDPQRAPGSKCPVIPFTEGSSEALARVPCPPSPCCALHTTFSSWGPAFSHQRNDLEVCLHTAFPPK